MEVCTKFRFGHPVVLLLGVQELTAGEIRRGGEFRNGACPTQGWVAGMDWTPIDSGRRGWVAAQCRTGGCPNVECLNASDRAANGVPVGISKTLSSEVLKGKGTCASAQVSVGVQKSWSRS
jgi:hypothetical protein